MKEEQASSLFTQGVRFFDDNQIEIAYKMFQSTEEICREDNMENLLQKVLFYEAEILRRFHHKDDEALTLYKELEQISRRLGDRGGLLRSLVGQALILNARFGRHLDMEFFKEMESLSRELDSKEYLAMSYNGQAQLKEDFRDPDSLNEALDMYQKAEEIYRQLNRNGSIAESLDNRATAHALKSEFDKALQLFEESERIWAVVENKEGRIGQAYSLLNQAYMYKHMNRKSEAVSAAKKANKFAVDFQIDGIFDAAKEMIDEA